MFEPVLTGLTTVRKGCGARLTVMSFCVPGMGPHERTGIPLEVLDDLPQRAVKIGAQEE